MCIRDRPPAPPSTLYITLNRTGNQQDDYQRIQQIHQLLTRERGNDRFVLILKGEQRAVELTFPNTHTRYTQTLQRHVEAIVGSGNLRVMLNG